MDLVIWLVLALGGGFASTHYVMYRLRNANRMKSVMIMELQIESILKSLMQKTVIDRALLCKVHNGGAPILVGSEKKISVIIEPESSLEPHVLETYTAFPIDNAYKKVLIEMIEKKPLFVFHEISKQPMGIFRRKSEADGLVEVLHYFVGDSATGAYYLFLGTLTGPNMLLSSTAQHNTIEEDVVAIRKLIKRAIRKKLLS